MPEVLFGFGSDQIEPILVEPIPAGPVLVERLCYRVAV